MKKMLRSKWCVLIACFLSTALTILYLVRYKNISNYIIITQQNYLFGERAGKKLYTPVTFHHSEEQERRLQHLRKFCMDNRDSYGIDSLIRFIRSHKTNKAHFYVSDNKKIVYCGVPKVASTNWKRLLLLFESTINDASDMSVAKKHQVHSLPQQRLFSLISKEQVKKVLFHYYKFLFVRHPFERLVSAYRNKFVDKNVYFRTQYGSQILRTYRQNLTEMEYRRGKGVTFVEFASWVLDGHVFDDHWNPIDKICHPCVLPYNFVGKMETLVEDAKQVLHDIGSKESFPVNKTDGYTVSSKKLMYDYFLKLKPSLILRLYEKYKTDFLAFGYDIPIPIKKHMWRIFENTTLDT